MLKKRVGKDRGFEDKGWIQSYHTFSFEKYYDPEFLNFHNLRVLNEITLQEDKGIGEQFHKDMIICTYVLSGVLEYRDHIGNVQVIKPQELFILNAGTGSNYSLYNLSHYESAHFIQLWLNPEQNGLDLSFEKNAVQSGAKWGQFCLLASQTGRLGSLRLFQDVDIYITFLEEAESITFDSFPERYYWVQVVNGKFSVNGIALDTYDGLMISEVLEIEVKCLEEGELLLIDQG